MLRGQIQLQHSACCQSSSKKQRRAFTVAHATATRTILAGLHVMSLYAKYVLPRIIDLAMRNKETTRLRAECVPRARGDVLEVGIGSGLNLPFYSPDVQHVYGVDPSLELQRLARKRAETRPLKVEFL